MIALELTPLEFAGIYTVALALVLVTPWAARKNRRR